MVTYRYFLCGQCETSSAEISAPGAFVLVWCHTCDTGIQIPAGEMSKYLRSFVRELRSATVRALAFEARLQLGELTTKTAVAGNA